MIKNVIDFLNNGWVGSTIAILGIVIGVLIAIWSSFVSRIGGRPVYQYRSLRLIGTNYSAMPSDVEVRFKGQIVNRLTKTEVVIWNSGNQTINGAAIVLNDPLRFEFGNGSRILDVSVLRVTRDVNDFKAKIDPKSQGAVLIDFDYLDPDDGALIEILHNDGVGEPDVMGSIRGVPKGMKNLGRIGKVSGILNIMFLGESKIFRRKSGSKSFFIVMFIFGIVFSLAGAFAPNSFLTEAAAGPLSENSSRGIIIFAGLTYAAFPLVSFWATRRRYPKALASSDLDK